MVAAGNDGTAVSPTGSQIGGLAAAKNVITVGATHSSRHYHDSTLVAELSSRGPVYNENPIHRRIKPDLVAPGIDIVSAKTRHPEASGCNDFPTPIGFPPLRSMSGTSMAAPLVAGCAATLRSAIIGTNRAKPVGREQHQPQSPSAALIKALLLNSATKLVDRYDQKVVPIRQQGFGRVDMRFALPPPPPELADGSAGEYPVTHGYFDYGVGGLGLGIGLVDGVGQSIWRTAMNIPPGQGTRVFKVTLVYTDPPGPLLQTTYC